jgi:hypothetical protein
MAQLNLKGQMPKKIDSKVDYLPGSLTFIIIRCGSFCFPGRKEEFPRITTGRHCELFP